MPADGAIAIAKLDGNPLDWYDGAAKDEASSRFFFCHAVDAPQEHPDRGPDFRPVIENSIPDWYGVGRPAIVIPVVQSGYRYLSGDRLPKSDSGCRASPQ